MIRYALSKTTDDKFPIVFRPDCERTYINGKTSKDETLLEVMERLDKTGYELINTLEKLNLRLKARVKK